MLTVIKDWQIVSVIENGKEIGQVIYATVVDDSTCRFNEGDYVCTSKITKIDTYTHLIKTTNGSLYQPLGNGTKSTVQFKDYELLRNGYNPQEIAAINTSCSDLVH